jgi:predicted phage terminase large subunit-like protein
MAVCTPPQHGKSVAVVDFIAWLSGKNPELKTIYSSFSERLGVRANLMLQRTFVSEKYKMVFPELKINTVGDPNTFGATRSRELLEYVGKSGFFRNTTVGGSITGESLDLSVVDDPIKGREEANSETTREKVWLWFSDDMMTRFSEDAGMLLIMTRWHISDPLGRLKEILGDELKIISYPAIAEKDEEFRKAGEALFPELKSLEFLNQRKAIMAATSWESLYQQNPQIIGGELIKGEHFGFYKQLPIIKERKIFADTAQKTAERNDFSVFECWGKGVDGKIYLIDLIRGKWEAPELKRRAIAFWNKHKTYETILLGQLRKMNVEDKSSGTGLIQDIKAEGRIPIGAIQRNKDKYTRVLDALGYIESGYIMLPEDAPFVSDFVSECEAFTADDSHMFDDQIDPMLDAIEDFLASNNLISLWENQS